MRRLWPGVGCGVWGVGNGALARVLDARVSPVYPSKVTIGSLTTLNMGLDNERAILTFHQWGMGNGKKLCARDRVNQLMTKRNSLSKK